MEKENNVVVMIQNAQSGPLNHREAAKKAKGAK